MSLNTVQLPVRVWRGHREGKKRLGWHQGCPCSLFCPLNNLGGSACLHLPLPQLLNQSPSGLPSPGFKRPCILGADADTSRPPQVRACAPSSLSGGGLLESPFAFILSRVIPPLSLSSVSCRRQGRMLRLCCVRPARVVRVPQNNSS